MKRLYWKITNQKKITYKYNQSARRMVCNYYVKYCEENIGFEITDFCLRVANDKTLNDQFNFSKISINTIKNILKEDLGLSFTKKPKKYKYHPKRTQIVEPGHVQLDLKILGKKETGTKQTIAIFDMIETHSRFAFSFVLPSQDIKNVLAALKQGKRYFERNGIHIKSIQTDNAMMFKGTNFVTSNDFVKYL